MHTDFLRRSLRPCFALGSLLAVSGLAPCAEAAAPTILHSFAPANTSAINSDGVLPVGVTLGSDGDWYGVAIGGGSLGGGTVFKMHPDGSGFTVLKAFSGDTFAPDGGYPGAPLTLGKDGYLYGTNSNGGANSDGNSSPGTIFRISPTGQYQTLFSFPTNDADPAHGGGQVFEASDGVLYGDIDTKQGTLFRMNADGTGYQTIHTFAAENSDTTNVGGAYPESVSAEGTDGFLYGEAQVGGTHGGGTIFKIAKDGTGFTVLHNFDGTNPQDGAVPAANLRRERDGSFYGTTSQGGANGTGIVFKIDQTGNFQQLDSFPALQNGLNTLGANPAGDVGLAQGPDGTLYGTTVAGGANGYGTVFAVQPDGSRLTDLYDFRQADLQTTFSNFGFQSSFSDFGYRYEVVFGSNGLLYITIDGGGANGTGSILTLPSLSAQSHLLWTNISGQAAVWNLFDPNPAATASLYGPFAGWTAKQIAQGPDGHARLLWTNTDGRAALWNLADANPAATCAVYGPFSGWSAKSLTVGSDNAAHLLWDNTSGQVALWNTTDANPSATCTVAGPYAGWSGTAISIGSDNHERLLWDNVNGQIAVWNLADSSPASTAGVYGPFSGWTAKTITVGDDNAAHLLWDNTNGQVALWNLTDVNPSATCTVAGPYSGWSGQDLSVGSDSKGQLLWDNTSGQVALWNLTDANPAATCLVAGPYSGWTAVSVAAGR